LLRPGDTVVIEEPSFRGAIEILRTAGAQLVGVPSGDHGVAVDALEVAVRRHRPAFVLLQSTVNNPTGAVLPNQARTAVARMSTDLGFTVVDDAATADVLVDGPMPRPLAAHGGRIVTIGSASKGFWGGLRVGWLRADRSTVDRLTVVKGAEDLGTSIPAQLVTARLLGRADEARAARRAALGAARATVLDTLAAELPDWRPRVPAGGGSMWVELPEGWSATAFAERAGRAGVDVLAGPTFSCHDALDEWLRIGYAVPFEVLHAGLVRLVSCWNALSGQATGA
ncbi:MAG: aminotransferase class I/II-fold pyridoxal phosphate-dependent enzyme, partial [Streptosporangiales bacterium]|nr:aminotransferase class I/II-fold pyridoxal phosphate-dependent enzyme [Streptosporangiales bacterium]